MTTLLFECVCDSSVLYFKHLFDMLMQISPLSDKNPCMREAYFKIDSNGLKIYTNVDCHGFVISNCERAFFKSFKLLSNEFSVVVNLEYLKQFFKNVKKTDTISFSIFGNEQMQPLKMRLGKIQVKGLVLNNEITVHMTQSEYLNYEECLNNPIIVSSDVFTSLCRSLNLQPGWIDIKSYNDNSLIFSFNINEITYNQISINSEGNLISSSEEEITAILNTMSLNDRKIIYSERFNANCLKNTAKLANMSSKVNIYVNTNHPLVIEAKNELSHTRIWIKANQNTEC